MEFEETGSSMDTGPGTATATGTFTGAGSCTHLDLDLDRVMETEETMSNQNQNQNGKDSNGCTNTCNNSNSGSAGVVNLTSPARNTNANANANTSASSGCSIRVSFREDVVVFPDHDAQMTNISTSKSYSTSKSKSKSEKQAPVEAAHAAPVDKEEREQGKEQLKKMRGEFPPRPFSKLRSNLTREQANRDPFLFYEVTKILGAGSMGEVILVKKRADRVGGSARRDFQEAIKRQQRERECLSIPIVGSFFQFCMDGNLKLNMDVNVNGNVDASKHRQNPDSSKHSLFGSFRSHKSNKSNKSSTGKTATSSTEDSDHMNMNMNMNMNMDSMIIETSDIPPSSSFDDASFISTSSESDIIYAIKSIHLQDFTNQAFVDELRNEIDILKDLDHPNIVRAIETFEFKGKISIVMELCAGGDLYSREPYSEHDTARIVTSILSAIAYMHSRNVSHRDLKFENILFANTSPMSDIKLIDFGLSRVYVDAKLTDIVGTIYTMAPEVLLGNYTEKADMWSIGVITFMLLSSALPFYGGQRVQVARRIINCDYKFKGKRWKKVSTLAKEFIARLLVSDPDHRLDAESALAFPWFEKLNQRNDPTGRNNNNPRQEEVALATSAIVRYATYPKLKKLALMVIAHKSSSEEIDILRRIFQKYDLRNDGSIWFEQFCEAMAGLDHSEQELRSIFNAVDLDGTNRIRYTEFIAATIEAHGAISEARLAEAFDCLDGDDSGYITASDLIAILGHGIPRDEIDTIIAEADLTKDNSVSYSEYLALWENQCELNKVLNPSMRGLSSISTDEDESETEAHAEFLLEKHLQNTLHTWAQEMLLPAHEFAMGCSFLHQVALGLEDKIETLVQERPSLVNFRDYDRRTALHIAAAEGHVHICQYLVEKGARVNRSDRWGGFPLDDAHRHRHGDVVNVLREHGAKFGSTSQTVNLITAASQGNVEEVRTLLEFGSIDLNQGDYDHRTALHLAANEGHLEVVELLCHAGADVNVKDRWGDRPRDDAKNAKKNSSEIMKILEEAAGGSYRSTTGSFSLTGSAYHQAPMMRDLKDKSNLQTVRITNMDQEAGMTQLPVQEFAMGCSLLHQAALGNQLVLEKILQGQPELVNFKDYDRRTALHIAASEGQLGICQYLVLKGGRINRCDRWGGSPLDDAHRHRHGDVVKFLRANGAKFGSTSQVTNFITAASEGDVEEVEAFLEYGSVDVNIGDYDRRTALHLAAGEGHLVIVLLLCEAGADVNVKDRWGRRPLDDAAKHAKKNSSDIMRLLLKHGARSTVISTIIKTAFLKFSSG